MVDGTIAQHSVRPLRTTTRHNGLPAKRLEHVQKQLEGSLSSGPLSFLQAMANFVQMGFSPAANQWLNAAPFHFLSLTGLTSFVLLSWPSPLRLPGNCPCSGLSTHSIKYPKSVRFRHVQHRVKSRILCGLRGCCIQQVALQWPGERRGGPRTSLILCFWDVVIDLIPLLKVIQPLMFMRTAPGHGREEDVCVYLPRMPVQTLTLHSVPFSKVKSAVLLRYS